MSQHKASLERSMRSALRHKQAGTEVATAILAIEAMVLTTITQSAIVENTDKKEQGRCRASMSHRSYGKRLADAITTMDAIIAADSLVAVGGDKELKGQHKASLKKVARSSMSLKALGNRVTDMVVKAESAIDELIVLFPLDVDLPLIKAILEL